MIESKTRSQFMCLACADSVLVRDDQHLACPGCGATYAISRGVPVLLPPRERLLATAAEAGRDVSFEEAQAIYDRVYKHGDLMGTDLDETYDQTTKEILLSFAWPLAGKRVLDLGGGGGNLWDYVTEPVDAYALDVSLEAMAKAAERHPALVVAVAMAEYLPYQREHFDVVVAADTIEHTFSPVKALAEIRRVLKPSGALCASFPVPDSLRKWGRNRLLRERPQIRLMARLLWMLLRRTVLFGSPNFQPIDRDLTLDEWMQKLDQAGFDVEKSLLWPEPPKESIVYLVGARRRE